jgi:hypothetical protein
LLWLDENGGHVIKGQPICCELRYPFDELEIEPSVFEVSFKAG